MDVESLISAIFQRNALWDKRLKSHSNRNIVQNLWKEVCNEMGIEETVLRKKWKYLRDQFSVEFGKVPKTRSGDPAPNYTVKWPYFQSLLFLKDIVKSRTSGGNCAAIIQSTEVEGDTSERNNEVSIEETDIDLNTLPNDDSITVPNSDKTENIEVDSKKHSSQMMTKQKTAIKRKSNNYSWNEEIIKIEQQKLQYLQEKANKRSREADGDDHNSFFNSLLPHVRKIPPNKILSFRGRVQQIVDEYAYGQSSLYVATPQVSPYSSSVYSSSSLYSASVPSAYDTESETPNDLLNL
ncbi:hypothetical protein FQR65_LT17392 [Abscondita terminalis]|nr:hypothetical protein FQR65_LT17392 [Abscondita terminalis]